MTTLTSAQIDRIAHAIRGRDVAHVRIDERPNAVRYQIHYTNGTFGSWVSVMRNGDLPD